MPVGEFKWLTVVSPNRPDDAKLLFEPKVNPPAKTLQTALFQQGIPLTAFAVDDTEREYEPFKALEVALRTGPTAAGPTSRGEQSK